jgi:hypothetical protein
LVLTSAEKENNMEFDWDDGNTDKNLKHGVHDWEIEKEILEK